MFGFDGEYRRRPIQSLGGASQTCDRETVIKKAQQERQRRNEMRLRNNSAIVLQSYTRSFICRQRHKNNERRNFDEYMQNHHHKIMNEETIGFLLSRIIFFYNSDDSKDAGRLIEICQHILKNYDRLLSYAVDKYIWLHRVQRLLNLCINQLRVTQISQAIPLRVLETLTDKSSVELYVKDDTLVQKYFQQVFQYLIKNDYFKILRELLQIKCPPLDGEILHSPNPFSEALLQLILRPLNITNNSNDSEAYESFAQQILSPVHNEPIRFFLIPCIAESPNLSFEKLLVVLDKLHKPELLLVTINDDMEVDNHLSVKSNTNGIVLKSKKQEQLLFESPTFSSFILYSLLRLDKNHLDSLHCNNFLRVYIKIIAVLSSKFLKIPRSALKSRDLHHNHKRTHLVDESSDDDDEYNEEFTKNDGKESKVSVITEQEKEILMDCVDMLNESQRVQILLNHIKAYVTDKEVLFSLCQICHNLMILNKSAIFEYKLLYTMSFIPEVIHAIWFNLADESSKQGFSAPLLLISKGVEPKTNGVERTIAMVATFCMLFGRLLPTLHDAEFIDNSSSRLLLEQTTSTIHVRLMPFSIDDIKQLSKTLKEISMGLVELAFPETRSSLNEHYRDVLGRSESYDLQLKQHKKIWANLLKVVVFVLNQLHTRDLRLGFCPESHWTVATLDLPLDRPADLPLTRGSRTRGIRPFQPIRDFTREDLEDGPPMSTKQIRSITILREIPFVVPFQKRVSVLQGLIAADKMRVQGHLQAFLQGPLVTLTVRRSHLYEDAFDKLRPENEPDLRLKFRVQFVSILGLDEAGIDGGGVFREFLSELIRTAFDPNRGFFMVTTDNKLYPNPNVYDIVPDFEKHYYFIGRILGKAIYENLLVELPLAEFFLTKLAGKYADVDIHQLASLDPELYKNLLYLKDYEGDVSDLNLDFTVASNSLGHTQIIELKPNGQSVAVNNSNRIEYLQLMADYKLNVQIRRHCKAFRRGLSNVLPVEWLYMFSNKELQVLISGAEIPIDLEDLKKHCKYGGDYNAEHPTIIIFWKVFDTFTDLQRRQLLKFVTSCSRAPLLGFKNLDPPFFIQNAGDTERLPTASTCTNLLKLPPLRTEEQMREKLLYAISAAVGFELS